MADDENLNEENKETEAKEQAEEQAEQEAEVVEYQEHLNFLKKRRYAIDKTKLENLKREVFGGIKQRLSLLDKRLIKRAKGENSANKKLATEIETKMVIIKSVKAIRRASTYAVPICYVLLGLICLLILIVAVVALIAALPEWLQERLFGKVLISDEEKQEYNISASFGVKGDKFYGCRTVFKDDTQAGAEIIEEYVDYVLDAVNIATSFEVQPYTLGEEPNEKTYIATNLTVNINVPSQDFDYLNFDEEEFKISYPQVYSVINSLAEQVYKQDNGTVTAPESLIEKVAGIKYFGVSNSILGTVETDNSPLKNIAELVLNNLKFDLVEGAYATQPVIENPDQGIVNEINNNLKVDILNKFKTDYVYAGIRTEKLFVKDYIFASQTATMPVLEEKQYVAYIFMPKQNVTITKFSFNFVGIDEDFEVFLTNENTISNKFNLQQDTVFAEDGSNDAMYFYCTSTVNCTANQFENVDANNLSALSEGSSLFGITKLVENADLYLQNEGEIYTFKHGGITLYLNSNNIFTLTEFETEYN